MSGHWRVQQWATFAKQFWIYDATMQCPMLSGELIAKYLRGLHKPIYTPGQRGIGDSVIVINSRHIAAKDNSKYWERFLYFTHTKFGKRYLQETMGEVHARDPTAIMFREIRINLPNWDLRKEWEKNCYLHADGLDTVDPALLANVTGVIPQVLPVPKRLDQYTAEELENFPKLFEFPADYDLGRKRKEYDVPKYPIQKAY